MPQSTHRYRGYLVGLEHKNGRLLICVSPATPDLPILHRCLFETAAHSMTEALAEAKSRVDQALA
jgi:hypothetical protein